MEIRALIFDINGTLIDIETDERMEQAYRAIGHFLTYQGITLHRGAVQELYFQIMKEQFAESQEVYPEFDAVAIWRKVVERRASEYTRALPAEKHEQLPLFLAEMHRGISRKRLVLFPRVLEVLGELKGRYRMAIVSDAQSAWARQEIRAVGLPECFDPVVISGDYGYRKPDVRLFQRALDGLQIPAGETVFIGNDGYRDVFGARQLGMRTILFHPAQEAPRLSGAEPDYRIQEFAELPRALDFLLAL